MELGWRLFQARKRVGLSQEELAGKLNVSRQAISKWERGEAVPDVANFITLAKLFGTTVDDLLTGAAAGKGGASAAAVETEQAQEDAYYTVDDTGNNSAAYMDEDARRSEIDAFMNEIPVENLAAAAKAAGSEYQYNMKWDGNEVERDLEVNIAGMKAHFNRKKTLQATYPVIVTVAYFLLGFVFHWWHPGWLLFLTIPLYYTMPDLENGDPVRELQKFAYPVLVTLIYLIIGLYFGWWHPWWMLYLTVPLYYIFLGNAKISK